MDGGGRLPRLARRQRAICRCRGRRRALARRCGGAAAAAALRCDPLYRAAGEAGAARWRPAWRRWPRARPVIIDESDGALDAFVQARALGYAGVSSKACKGVWRVADQPARAAAPGMPRAARRLLHVGRGPDDPRRGLRAAGPGAGGAARPGPCRAQRPPLHRRLRRPPEGRGGALHGGASRPLRRHAARAAAARSATACWSSASSSAGAGRGGGAGLRRDGGDAEARRGRAPKAGR